MEEIQVGIERLGREVTLVRGGKAGKKIIWSAAIRDLAVNLVSGGVSVENISSVTGIRIATIRRWHSRRFGHGKSASFCELGIGGIGRGIVVKLLSGAEISGLGISHIEQFLKSGLI